jgi:outer membrane protein assembly factor BamB
MLHVFVSLDPVGRTTVKALLLSAATLGLLAPLPARRVVEWSSLGRDGWRNAVSPDRKAPLHWQADGDKQVNILWKAKLGNSNNAPPVVSDGLVWVGTNNANPRDPAVKGEASVLMCFRASDGTFLWQYVSSARDDDRQMFKNAAINCAPLVEGDRLYFTTVRCDVVCLDIGPLLKGDGDPRMLWALDMQKALGVAPVALICPARGFTCSLAPSYRNRLYVTTANSVDASDPSIPAPDAPALLCLDRDTGKVLWSDKLPGKDILYSQWSSPLVVEIQGRGQVVAAQGDGWVRSFDAMTGELIWKFDTNPKAAVWRIGGRGTRNFLPATPVYHDGLVYIGNGKTHEHDNEVGHLWCIDATRIPKNKEKDLSPVGDNFDPRADVNKDSGLVWHHGGPIVPPPKDGPRSHFGGTLSSVAIHDGLVIAPDAPGYIHCLDARTGRHYWTHDTGDSIYASPLIADGKVYVPTDSGTVNVLALSKEKKVLAQNELDSTCGSGAVFVRGVLYIATDQNLFAIKEK